MDSCGYCGGLHRTAIEALTCGRAHRRALCELCGAMHSGSCAWANEPRVTIYDGGEIVAIREHPRGLSEAVKDAITVDLIRQLRASRELPVHLL